MKRITLAILVVLTALLHYSCEPQDLALFNVEAIIIDKTNTEEYMYSDLADPNMGWVSKENGDTITYFFEGDTIFISSEDEVKNVYYLDGNNKILSPPVYDSKYFSQVVDTTRKNVFRMYY